MSLDHEYLIAVTAWTTHHFSVVAASEEAACNEAERLWEDEEACTSLREGGIETITVLSRKPAPFLPLPNPAEPIPKPCTPDTEAIVDATLIEIVQCTLLIPTLEPRDRDALDFHEVSVTRLKAALRQAYEAGRKGGVL